MDSSVQLGKVGIISTQGSSMKKPDCPLRGIEGEDERGGATGGQGKDEMKSAGGSAESIRSLP